MAASQTIETYQLGITQSATSEKEATLSAKNSDDFKNIFDNINQNYSSDNKTKTTQEQKPNQSAQTNTTQTNQETTSSANQKTTAQTNNETNTTVSENEPVTQENSINSAQTEVKPDTKAESNNEQTTANAQTTTQNSSTQISEPNIEAQMPLFGETSNIPQETTAIAIAIATPTANESNAVQMPQIQPETNTEITPTTNINADNKNVEYTQAKSEPVNMDIKTILNDNSKIQELMQTNTTVQDLKTNLAELSDELKKTLSDTLEAKGMTEEEALKENPSSIADIVQTINELDGIIKSLDESQTPTEQIDITQNTDSNITASTSTMPITIAPETLDWVSKISLNTEENNFPQSIPIINLENIANAKTNSDATTAPLQPIINDLALQTNPTAVATPALNGQDTQQQPLLAQAAAEVLSNSDLNLNNNKTTESTANKNPLTQEMLDNMDAKITSVKTSTSSNQNTNQNSNQQGFLQQQNIQEQTIKLELQNNTAQTVATANVTTNIDAAQQDLSTVANLSATTQTQNSSIATPKEITDSDIMEQINKQLDAKTLQNSQNNATTRVSIVLRPENLGKIELELINSKDGLVAKMITDNAQVKDFLDKNLNGLRETLGAQGVNVNNVSVKVNETQEQDTTFSFEKQTNQENSQQQAKNSNNKNELTEEPDKITEINETTETEISQNTTSTIKDFKTYNERGRIL